MCLILFAWQPDTEFPLVVASNRDEYHARESEPATFWKTHPEVLAGRDLEANGTWMGTTRQGRFAAVTNFREALPITASSLKSRGALVEAFLIGQTHPLAYAEHVSANADAYRGFNLLIGDKNTLVYVSNRGKKLTVLDAGIYGLSNHLLDTPWPKVVAGKTHLQRALSHSPNEAHLLHMLSDVQIATDDTLPDTGVGIERERMLSPIRLISPNYGTRVSTVLIRHQHGTQRFSERRWNADGTESETLRYLLGPAQP